MFGKWGKVLFGVGVKSSSREPYSGSPPILECCRSAATLLDRLGFEPRNKTRENMWIKEQQLGLRGEGEYPFAAWFGKFEEMGFEVGRD